MVSCLYFLKIDKHTVASTVAKKSKLFSMCDTVHSQYKKDWIIFCRLSQHAQKYILEISGNFFFIEMP